MRSLLGCALLVALVCLSAAETSSTVKVGPRLAQFLAQGERDHNLPLRNSIPVDGGSNEETTAIWVLFRSKCADNSASKTLSDRAILRRAKHGFTTDESDRPLCQDWKHQLSQAFKALQHTPVLRGESHWLNAVSLNVAISELREAIYILHRLPFVAEVEVVGRLIRDSVPLSDEEEHMDTVTRVNLLEKVESSLNVKQEDQVKSTLENYQQRAEKRATLDLDYGTSFSQLDRMGIPAMHRQGLDGTGVIISVLDSGFNRAHESLRDLHVVAAWDFVHNDSNVGDEGAGEARDSHHGTGTWSNIGARKSGQLYGASYNASYILCKTEDAKLEYAAEEDFFVRAIEYSENYGADILSASLGYMDWHTWSDYDGYHSVISRVANRAIDMGLLFVVANGNAASRGIGTPADLNRVLSLGALAASPATSLASFSSLGPTYDGRIKPDVAAPGQSIKVALFSNLAGYSFLSGTSFATPLTAGVAGLLLQAHPTWTNMNLRDAIIYTATPSPSGGDTSPNIHFGWGMVNGPAALAWSPPANPASICAPNGAWNSSTQRCDCQAGWYNSDCKTHALACRDWCLSSNSGLCSTQGECMCTARSAAGRCTSNATYLTWTCPNAQFNDGQICNCGCGLYDPDCDIPNAPIMGCAQSTDNCVHNTNNHQGVCSSLVQSPQTSSAPSLSPPSASPPTTTTPTTSNTPKSDSTSEPQKKDKSTSRFKFHLSLLLNFFGLFFR